MRNGKFENTGNESHSRLDCMKGLPGQFHEELPKPEFLGDGMSHGHA
jgi:hypothetical protein